MIVQWVVRLSPFIEEDGGVVWKPILSPFNPLNFQREVVFDGLLHVGRDECAVGQ
jgi:hypothetical protein